MAVRALTQSHSRAAQDIGSLPTLALGLALVPTALDLLGIVQSTVKLASLGTFACAAAGAVLLLMWLRFPHVSWLLAASIATGAGLAMRLVGADVAPVLSLLSILALGVGGAFAGPEVSPARA
jgi:hypothetical protein